MNATESIFHDRSFNIDGVLDRSDECNFDHYTVMSLCPDGCKEDSRELRSLEYIWEQLVSLSHYAVCPSAKFSASAKCYHESVCSSKVAHILNETD